MYFNKITHSKYFHERKIMNNYEKPNSNQKEMALKRL